MNVKCPLLPQRSVCGPRWVLCVHKNRPLSGYRGPSPNQTVPRGQPLTYRNVMKPIRILSLVLAGAWTGVAVLGQASFLLRNYVPTYGVDAPVYDWAGALLSGSGWRAELYGGATQDSLSPVIGYYSGSRESVPLVAPGYFLSNAGFQSVSGVPAGGWAWLQLRVWDVQLGPTYETAATRGLGGYGESALFYAQGGNPLDALALPAPLIGLQSFSVLQITPEPGTWVLLVAGLGGLVWSGRRKRALPRHPEERGRFL